MESLVCLQILRPPRILKEQTVRWRGIYPRHASNCRDPRFIRKKCVGTGAIIGDGDRKSWDPRGPMIWDNFLFLELIIYMKKLLDSDWLRAVQFFLNTVQKRGN